jgi:DNA repair photolyase
MNTDIIPKAFPSTSKLRVIKPFDPWRSPLCTCPMKWVLHPYTGCAHLCLYCYAANYIPRHNIVRPKNELIYNVLHDVKLLPKGALVEMSTSSDPYTPPEDRLQLTRRVLQILLESGLRVLITTKSSLVVRDLDILSRFGGRVAVAITITTVNDELARVLEPGAPPPSERLKAVEILSRNGIPVTVRVDPIIPLVNDDPSNIEKLVKAVAKAGAVQITSSTYKAKPIDFKKMYELVKRLHGERGAEEFRYLYFEDPNSEKVQGYRYLRQAQRFEYMKTIKELAENEGLAFATCREGFAYLHTPGIACDGSSYTLEE